MTFIDTAEAYVRGRSEAIIAKAVKGIRKKVFIATKVSPENLSYDSLLRSAEGSLRRLETDYIDLYQVHWSNPKIPISETIRAMEQLLKAGTIRFVGMCNLSLKELRSAQSSFGNNVEVALQAG